MQSPDKPSRPAIPARTRMTPRRAVLFALVPALVVVLCAAMLFDSQPSYQGVKLETLIIRSSSRYFAKRGPDPQAEAAIRAIGTNALPTLLKWLQKRDGPVKEKLVDWTDNHAWLKGKLLTPASAAHERALQGFRVLGPMATPAIPKLVELLNQTETAEDAANALFSIGQPAAGPLMNALTNRDPSIRATAASALEQGQWVPPMQRPLLEKCMADPEPQVREFASWFLGRTASKPVVEPAVAVNFLVTELRSTNQYSAWEAILALEHFGAQARPAVPALQAALKSQDPSTRKEAAAALKKIDPEAAKQAGVQ